GRGGRSATRSSSSEGGGGGGGGGVCFYPRTRSLRLRPGSIQLRESGSWQNERTRGVGSGFNSSRTARCGEKDDPGKTAEQSQMENGSDFNARSKQNDKTNPNGKLQRFQCKV